MVIFFKRGIYGVSSLKPGKRVGINPFRDLPFRGLTLSGSNPNPAHEWFTLEMMSNDNIMDGNLEIIRMDGPIMRSMNINQFSTTIEVSEFDSGIYFIRYTKGNRYSMERMVIQQ